MATPRVNSGRAALVAVLMGTIKHRSIDRNPDWPIEETEANPGVRTGSSEPHRIAGYEWCARIDQFALHACMHGLKPRHIYQLDICSVLAFSSDVAFAAVMLV